MFDRILAGGARLTAVLRTIARWSVVFFYSYMAFAVLAQVFGRYLFNYSIGWATETATFAQIWMVLLAAGVAMERNLHVGVDVLSSRLPLFLYRAVTLLIGVACLWFLYQAIIGSFAMIRIGQIQTSPALGLPMWIPYLSMPIGLTYFAFELILSFAQKWQGPHPEEISLTEDAA
jgi:TRAP-type C4-dicarboxylate transport system permease small subunit